MFSSKQKISSVTFRCKYNTNFGSSLYVIGNLNLLGQWNVNNAIPLSTSSETYPLWTLKNAFSCPVGTEITYKYLTKDGDGKITWENLPNNKNRVKIISKPGEFIIEDEENNIKPEMGETENYDKIIKKEDIEPKKEKRKKKKNNESDKKNKNNNKNNKDNKDLERNINNNNDGLQRIKSEEADTFHLKIPIPIRTEDTEENEDSIENKIELKNNPDIIDLKMGLDDYFKISDNFSYDINLIFR